MCCLNRILCWGSGGHAFSWDTGAIHWVAFCILCLWLVQICVMLLLLLSFSPRLLMQISLNVHYLILFNFHNSFKFSFSLKCSLCLLCLCLSFSLSLSQAALGYSGICFGFWCHTRVLQPILPSHQRRGNTLKMRSESLHHFSIPFKYVYLDPCTWLSLQFLIGGVGAYH